MTNRQKVAEKLREAGKELDNTFDESDDGDEFLAAFIATDLAIGQPKRSPFEFSPFFNRLADLIDPTCHQVIEDETQVCSECSEDLDEWYGWDFCPNCGARVVRDEA